MTASEHLRDMAEPENLAARAGVRQPYPVSLIAPVHMRSAENIALIFKVHKDTVKGWHKEGAPIAVVGGAYSAEYNALMAWLCQRNRK